MLLVTFKLTLLFLAAIYKSTTVQVHAEVVVFVEYSQVFMGSREFTHWKNQDIITFQNTIVELAKATNTSTNEVFIECHLQNQAPIRRRRGRKLMREARRRERRRRRPRRRRKTGRRNLLSLRKKPITFQARDLQQSNEDSRTRENASAQLTQQISCSTEQARSITMQYSVQWKTEPSSNVNETIAHLTSLKAEFETFMLNSDGRKAVAAAMKPRPL